MLTHEVADLFYKGSKPNFDALDGDLPYYCYKAALHDDAIDFIRAFPDLCVGVSARELVESFWNRV